MMNLKELKKKIYPDGEMYEGEFHNGEYNGKGVWHYSDGAKLEGIWEDGFRNGKFHKTFPNGKEYIIEYKDNLKIHEEEVK